MDQTGKQISDLVSCLNSELNKKNLNLDTPNFLDLGDGQLDEISSVLADDDRFKDLWSETGPYISPGKGKALLTTSSFLDLTSPDKKLPTSSINPSSLTGKRPREEMSSFNNTATNSSEEPPCKKALHQLSNLENTTTTKSVRLKI